MATILIKKNANYNFYFWKIIKGKLVKVKREAYEIGLFLTAPKNSVNGAEQTLFTFLSMRFVFLISGFARNGFRL